MHEISSQARAAHTMIARVWRGRTRAEQADRYLDYLHATGVRDYRRIPGNRGVQVLRQFEGAIAEFLVVSFWDSFDAIRRFAGADVERAVYYPRDAEFLLELEPHVVHYEVRAEPHDAGVASERRAVMSDHSYLSAHISQIRTVRASNMGDSEWKPVRHHFGIDAFGVNAYVAAAPGERIVPEHHERPEPGTGEQEHQELYYVGSGRATFTVAGESVDAPAGTFVYVRDPGVVRSAVAREAGTIVLAVGAQPGVPFEVSGWETSKIGG